MLAGFCTFFCLSKQHGIGVIETFAILSGWRSVSVLLGVQGGGERVGGKEGMDWELAGMVGNMSLKAVFKFLLEKGETFVLLQQVSLISVSIHTRAHTHAHTRTHTHTLTYIHTYTPPHTHTLQNTHTQIHPNAHKQRESER